jgi:hypothetical protein
MKPPPHKHAAVTPTHLGPTSSSHFPAIAAAKPRQTIATENIHIILLKFQSSAELVTTPSSLIKAGLNILQA